MNLALGEAAAVESLGGQIFEDSAVTGIDQQAITRVNTARGSVTAKYVVVAGNAYLNGLLPKLEQKAMPCGTQVIATEPLSKELQQQLLPKDECVEDCNYLLDYFRLSGDGRLIYGGGVTYGAREPGKIESLIVPKMLKTFPMLKDTKVDFAWTGNFLLTLMRLPQFGRIGNNIFTLRVTAATVLPVPTLPAGLSPKPCRDRLNALMYLPACHSTRSPVAVPSGFRIQQWVHGITRCAINWASDQIRKSR